MDGVLGFLSALALTAIATRLLYPLALRWGWTDAPDGVRKRHQGEVPLIGGLAILMGILGGVWIQGFLAKPVLPEWRIWLVCISILAMVGFVDDFTHRVSPALRMLVQIVVALIAILGAHLVLTRLGDLWGSGRVVTGLWATPFTVLCFVGVTNSMNLIDGVDGLAGSVALAPLFWIILFAYETGQGDLGATGLALAGSLVAFLGFNFDHGLRRTRIFLGSGGATVIGFTLAWFLVHLSQARVHPLPPIVAVWIMGLPILETVTVMIRRLIRRRHPLYGGRDHLHHFWLHLGRSNRAIALGEAAAALALGGVGYWGWAEKVPAYVLSLGFIGLSGIYFAGLELLERKRRWAAYPEKNEVAPS